MDITTHPSQAVSFGEVCIAVARRVLIAIQQYLVPWMIPHY